jgi:uncharacterized protein (UPF0333 family)
MQLSYRRLKMRILKENAQLSLEYLTVVAVMLVIVTALAGYAFLMYNETITLNQVKDALNDLKKAVNRVYDLGEGNSIVVEISLPPGITGTKVVGRAIYITSTLFGTSSQDLVETDANVHGSLPTAEGIHYIEVRAIDGNVSLSET